MVKRIPKVDKVRVGFAGAGAISQYHLVGWSEMPDARLVAICDIDEAKARAKAQAFNIPNVYTDFRTMIEREAEELIAYVGKRVRFMVHENYRFRPHYVQVRQWLQRGRIGEITHARM